MEPASPIQTMPAEMVSDYLTCRQEQKILVPSLRFERRSVKALASPFASRLIDTEVRTKERPAVNPLASCSPADHHSDRKRWPRLHAGALGLLNNGSCTARTPAV